MTNPMSNTAPIKIWIFRKGNGQLRVHPSPVLLNGDELFRIRNLTGADATASFPSGIVDDAIGVTIHPGATSQDLQVKRQPTSTYFEYEVTAGNDYADGGSKPGGIVDP